ncbi:unnamed protein product [Arctogadus glacialis]
MCRQSGVTRFSSARKQWTRSRVIMVTETVLFLIQYTSKEFDRLETTVATGDCCYLNPLVRRTFRFLAPRCRSINPHDGMEPVVTGAISLLRASVGLSPVVTTAISQPESLSRPQPCGDHSHQPA